MQNTQIKAACVTALLLTALWGSAAPAAEPLPDCALSGARSVTISGRPALRLSDVANCPPELYEVVDGIFIEGEPAIFFKTGKTDDVTCAATGDPSVFFNGRPASRLGDARCETR